MKIEEKGMTDWRKGSIKPRALSKKVNDRFERLD